MRDVWAQADHIIEKRKGRLKLGGLAAEVQALRDVKHFVKDYKGHLPVALPPTGIAGLAGPFKAFACMQICCTSVLHQHQRQQILSMIDAAGSCRGTCLVYCAHLHHWSLAHALMIADMPAPFLQVRPAQVP